MRSCRRVVVIVVMAMAVFAVTSAESSAWTSPVNVSGTTFTDRAPDAGIAGDQTATVVWQRDGFPYPLIQLRTRSGAGLWGPVRNLASGDRPAMAVAADGTAAVAWQRADAFGNRVRIAVGDPAGTLSTPADVSPPGVAAVNSAAVG